MANKVPIKLLLMERDRLSEEETDRKILLAHDEVIFGQRPMEEVLSELGLNDSYMLDILEADL